MLIDLLLLPRHQLDLDQHPVHLYSLSLSPIVSTFHMRVALSVACYLSPVILAAECGIDATIASKAGWTVAG